MNFVTKKQKNIKPEVNSAREVGVVMKLQEKMAAKEAADEAAEPTTKTCPYCYSEISINATRCPHCTSELDTKKKAK